MNIDVFVWDNTNIDHIARHSVEHYEVDELLENRYMTRRARNDCYVVYGQTHGGRFLTVVVAPRGKGHYYVVTARNMTDKEKHLMRKMQ